MNTTPSPLTHGYGFVNTNTDLRVPTRFVTKILQCGPFCQLNSFNEITKVVRHIKALAHSRAALSFADILIYLYFNITLIQHVCTVATSMWNCFFSYKIWRQYLVLNFGYVVNADSVRFKCSWSRFWFCFEC